MKVELERIDDKFQFQAKTEDHAINIMANPNLCNQGSTGFRPMQLLLSSLASCLSIDVLNILYKQRAQIQTFKVEVDSQRANAIPAVFEQIELHFQITGQVEASRVQNAINLGVERYCSVYHSLSPNIKINSKFTLNHEQ